MTLITSTIKITPQEYLANCTTDELNTLRSLLIKISEEEVSNVQINPVLKAITLHCKDVFKRNPFDKGRKTEIINARLSSANILLNYKFNFVEIADFFKVNRSTIYHYIKKHEEAVLFDKNYQKLHQRLQLKVSLFIRNLNEGID